MNLLFQFKSIFLYSRWLCTPPPPTFEAVYFIYDRRRLAVARYRIICLALYLCFVYLSHV